MTHILIHQGIVNLLLEGKMERKGREEGKISDEDHKTSAVRILLRVWVATVIWRWGDALDRI